ncbi:hypothetical protein PHOSAC3_150401 [Mesotoga infera]|nr:hypothetical protein PHOSAC3_150401 [Mesotoga infera]
MLVLVQMLCLTPDDPDLKSSLEGGGPLRGGGCFEVCTVLCVEILTRNFVRMT